MRWTREQLDEYERRQRREVNAALPDPDRPEDKLHEDILAWCKDCGVPCFHGSMAHRTRRTLGEPDFHIYLPAGRYLMIECKKRSGKLSVAQEGMRLWLAKMGHTVHVVKSKEEFLALVEKG